MTSINNNNRPTLSQRLDAAGDAAIDQNPGGRILEKVGQGMWAAARTFGMGVATLEVGKETFTVAKDLATGAQASSWAGKAGESVLGGVGEFIVAGGLAIATYNCALDTARSAVNGFKRVTAS